MIINWANKDHPVFITTRQAVEIMRVLEPYGLIGDWEWMTIGSGFNSDGEDADWHNPNTKVEKDELWEQELWELYGMEIVWSDSELRPEYPGQKAVARGRPKERQAIKSLKQSINEFAGEILYDLGYSITGEFLSLVDFDIGSATEKGRNDDYESYFGASWNLVPDWTKISKFE